MDKFQLKVSNNTVINVDEILLAIKEETDIEVLKSFYNFLSTRIEPRLYHGVDTILTELKSFINALEQVHNTYHDENTIMTLLSKYTFGNNITEEELLQVYSFISNEIALYENEIREYLEETNDLNIEQNRLDYIMSFIETKEKNEIETNLLSRYKKICANTKDFSGKSKGFTKKLLNPETPLSLSDNENGITTTIIIISFTLILGLFFAALLLVK